MIINALGKRGRASCTIASLAVALTAAASLTRRNAAVEEEHDVALTVIHVKL